MKAANQVILKSDICGFGYPIYGSDLPEIVKNFISGLETVKNKKAFMFCTQWLWSGDGAAEGRRYLRMKMCPVNNLVQSDESAEMSALGKCILCVRCYNFCPESAITYHGKSYNADSGIPYRGPKGLNK